MNGALYDIILVDKNTSPNRFSIYSSNYVTVTAHLFDSSLVKLINFSAFINLYSVNSISFSNIYLFFICSAHSSLRAYTLSITIYNAAYFLFNCSYTIANSF